MEPATAGGDVWAFEPALPPNHVSGEGLPSARHAYSRCVSSTVVFNRLQGSRLYSDTQPAGHNHGGHFASTDLCTTCRRRRDLGPNPPTAVCTRVAMAQSPSHAHVRLSNCCLRVTDYPIFVPGIHRLERAKPSCLCCYPLYSLSFDRLEYSSICARKR